jgi:signal transduction histidine kinase
LIAVTGDALPRWVRDGVLALVLAVATVVDATTDVFGGDGSGVRPTDVLAVVVLVVAIGGLQRRRPLAAIAAVALVGAIGVLDGHGQPIAALALLFLFYGYAAVTPRGPLLWTAAAVCAPLYLGGVVVSGGDWLSTSGVPEMVGLGAAAGDATRNRRAYIAEVESRARRAEQSRDQEAARRVVEERMRIARELHDLVAHHIAVIKVQASGARHVLRERPEMVEPSLDHISRSADEVLREIASLVGLLRTTDEPGTAAQDNAPTSGLSRLPVLLDDLASAGLRVAHRQTGVDRGLPAVVDLAAFRIVQEALTNAHKYGDGSADLRIEYSSEGISVQVTNPVRTGADGPGPVLGSVLGSGSGFGILGMQERAGATGGSLTAGLVDPGRFVVRAQLPAGTAAA